MQLRKATKVRAVIFSVLLALVATASLAAHSHKPAQAAAPRNHGDTWFTGTHWMSISKPFYARDFSLADQQGKHISLSEFRGDVVLLSFTSAVCTQQCPLVGRAVSSAERLLGAEARRTVLLNVSVDPEADSARKVQVFARKMGWTPYRWYYVWGPRRQMQSIWKAYGIYVPTPPPIFRPGLNIIHTAATGVIDQRGHVRAFFAYPFLPSTLSLGVRDLIEGKA